ncbi:tRNA (adenosine(37)-N6)-dimethylallyltransferase MiaA [Kineosporia succinea]|uniref:tRNA dimethylallyltransferase n=1 Tax=Kineosporia succinea TaxID=84632 RepID=A0ABT9NW14_9ACTN|nr:tRNA (adenosine(37)-N6)-dimethylallyltransferase MiaA [Kineosporia succinea]MDP9824614.1 tRNA dimethylallyltransferase [Kineosporia succinea]
MNEESVNTPGVIAVVGPTASGKSDLALDLAEALDGEVINADAMQLYRGMDIGTAKLPPSERRGVPHHLLDVLDVTEEASLAAYQREARAARDDIQARGKVPILAGGSGLYVRAVLDQLEIPPTDPRVRLRLEREGEKAGAEEMHRRLAAQDPAAAIAILPGNLRRIVRALEVIELTGRPFSATLPRPEYDTPAVQIGLLAPREELDDRIAARVVRMWRDGLVEETVRLVSEGLLDGRTAPRALGYAQVLRMLEGELDEVEAQVDTVNTTRKFARRQESWFRRDTRVTWLPYDAPDLKEQALAAIAGPRSLTP